MNNLPTCYDPESMTPQEREKALKKIYASLYPWHGTIEARHYDYPSFVVSVNEWAKDEFYRQHLTAKLYLADLESTK